MSSNISTQGCKMIKPSMMNIYCPKIRLRVAANQTIYLMIYHWVVGILCMSLLILLLELCRGLERVVISFAICPQMCLFWTERVVGHILCCPLMMKSVGTRPPRLPPIDAHNVADANFGGTRLERSIYSFECTDVTTKKIDRLEGGTIMQISSFQAVGVLQQLWVWIRFGGSQKREHLEVASHLH